MLVYQLKRENLTEAPVTGSGRWSLGHLWRGMPKNRGAGNGNDNGRVTYMTVARLWLAVICEMYV